MGVHFVEKVAIGNFSEQLLRSVTTKVPCLQCAVCLGGGLLAF